MLREKHAETIKQIRERNSQQNIVLGVLQQKLIQLKQAEGQK